MARGSSIIYSEVGWDVVVARASFPESIFGDSIQTRRKAPISVPPPTPKMLRQLLTYFNALDNRAEEIPRPNIDGSRVAHEPDHIVLGAPNIELVNRLVKELH